MTYEIPGYDAWKTADPPEVKEVTEKEACNWFNNQEPEEQDDMITLYPEFERLLDDEQADWYKKIDTDSVSFGTFLLRYYSDKIYKELR